MPVIPQFENDVAAQPTPPVSADPQAFARTGEALARGGAQLSDQMAEFNQRYIQAKRATAAADTMVGADKQLQNLSDKYSVVPDRQKALTGFNAEADKLRATVVGSVADPFAQSLVADRFDAARGFHAANVGKESFGFE